MRASDIPDHIVRLQLGLRYIFLIENFIYEDVFTCSLLPTLLSPSSHTSPTPQIHELSFFNYNCYTHTCTHTCAHTRIHINTSYLHKHAHTHTCINMYTWTHKCIHMHIHISTHVHTHAHFINKLLRSFSIAHMGLGLPFWDWLVRED